MSLTDMLSSDPVLATVVILYIIFVCGAVVGFGCACYCRKKYPGQTQPKGECIKCQLIDMGEIVSHTRACTGCGNVPPSLQLKV